MGVLLSSEEDASVFKEALNEAGFIVNRATKDKSIKSRIENYPSDTKPKSDRQASTNKLQGHCIKCGRSIPLALGKPYCPDCFAAWSEWENPNYKEHYCHNCSKPASTTM